jgi:hypothetical protein
VRQTRSEVKSSSNLIVEKFVRIFVENFKIAQISAKIQKIDFK